MKIIRKTLTATLLCTALLSSGCAGDSKNQTADTSAVSASESTVSASESADSSQAENHAVTENTSSDSQNSQESDQSVSENSNNETPDPKANESESSELYAMDTVMSLTAYGSHAREALDSASAEIQRLDKLFSISSETGDIYRVNRDGEGDLSEDTRSLLASALEYGKDTNGIFDCTIEPVMEAWGFTTKNYRIPSDSELAELLSHVDASTVTLSGNHVTLPEDVKLDLGGIAKGFTSARVMEVFKNSGVTSGIISLGGNVQTLGTKPDEKLWRVGIQDPNDLNAMFAVVEVSDEAVITSGAYQRYFEENGVHYHHIIDPRTGYPAESGLTSVTIISPDGTLADALSTSLFIMGPDDASAFWQNHRDKFEAIMMTENGEVLVTSGLADRCKVTNGGKVRVIS
ncbi:FAD:protein FMN transferase [Brotaphodocola catenula]|uniref:FAD:protein FMN transferase n=1 Tax=Brotaphodocola catenula TaxID=2885361 RepID=A0AAE3AS22_9FIRM|nr:FAD:protein FMN transferase [Brotaphodocola catenula]MCC2164322.1 FAD:protein FMN transferase [Brotaphodocola catenula]